MVPIAHTLERRVRLPAAELEVNYGSTLSCQKAKHKKWRTENVYVEIQVDPNPAKFVFVNRNFFKKVGDKLMRM